MRVALDVHHFVKMVMEVENNVVMMVAVVHVVLVVLDKSVVEVFVFVHRTVMDVIVVMMVAVVMPVDNVQRLKLVSMVNVQEHLHPLVQVEYAVVTEQVEVVVLVRQVNVVEQVNVNVITIVMKEIVDLRFKQLVLVQAFVHLFLVVVARLDSLAVLMDFVLRLHLVQLLFEY